MRRLNTADIAKGKGLIQSFLSFLRTVYAIKLTGLEEVKKQILYCKQIGLIYSRIFFGGSISKVEIFIHSRNWNKVYGFIS